MFLKILLIHFYQHRLAILFCELKSFTIITYFKAQIDTDLTSGRLFKVVPVSSDISLFRGIKCIKLICIFLAPDLESSISIGTPGSHKNGIRKPKSEP